MSTLKRLNNLPTLNNGKVATGILLQEIVLEEIKKGDLDRDKILLIARKRVEALPEDKRPEIKMVRLIATLSNMRAEGLIPESTKIGKGERRIPTKPYNPKPIVQAIQESSYTTTEISAAVEYLTVVKRVVRGCQLLEVVGKILEKP